VTGYLSILQIIGAVLGVWTLVSVAATLVLIPWFRAQARANAALSLRDRREDWTAAAHAADRVTVATR
jgi:hypothetical protein